MPTFKYKAKDKEGKEYEKTRDAMDRLELYSLIREEGGTVISIKEADLMKKISFLGELSGVGKSTVKADQKITFAKNLSAMIKAGLSVTRALTVLGKQAKNKRMKSLIGNLESEVSRGSSLSEAMRKEPKVFSSLFVSMVKAGEESGNVALSLEVVAGQMEKSHQLVKKVRGALIYPSIIFCLMIFIGILMLIFMVPTLTETYKGIGITLPLSTRIIIAISDFLLNHTLLVMMAGILSFFTAVSIFQSSPGKRVFDHISIRIPMVGKIVKEVQAARTARTLSSLLTSGVNITIALDVTKDVVQNHLYKNALADARTAIEKGEQMSQVFNRYGKIYPLFLAEMVAVGEETGKISDMLMNVANYYEEEVDQKTKDLSTIIEPVLMIIIGAGVGVFAISMLAPTYSLVNNI